MKTCRKIAGKSIRNVEKSFKNRSWTLSGDSGRFGGARGRSWEAPGGARDAPDGPQRSPATAKGAQKAGKSGQEGAKSASKAHPRAPGMRFWGERCREQLAQGARIDFRTFFCRCAGRPRHTRNFGNAPLRERCAAFFARRLAEQRDARTSIFVRPVQVLRGFTRIDVLRRDCTHALHARENRTWGA